MKGYVDNDVSGAFANLFANLSFLKKKKKEIYHAWVAFPSAVVMWLTLATATCFFNLSYSISMLVINHDDGS